jgi:phosphatidylglycerophosphate synthase
VARPISFRLTPFFINRGFSANGVTVLSLLPLALGLMLISLGAFSYANFVVGSILINIWLLFDCIDGNIARYRDEGSRFGALLDFMVGFSYHTFLPLCLAVGLYFSDSYSQTGLGNEIPRWYFLVAGVLEPVFGAFRKVVGMQFQNIVGSHLQRRGDSKISALVVVPRAILSFKAPLLLVASLIGSLGIFLFAYTAFNFVSLLAVIVQSLRGAAKADRQSAMA